MFSAFSFLSDGLGCFQFRSLVVVVYQSIVRFGSDFGCSGQQGKFVYYREQTEFPSRG